MSLPQATQPVPLPDDFPVIWDDPADEGRPWMRDRMHWPDQMPPLTYSVMASVFPHGFRAASHYFHMGLEPRMARFNTYFYLSVVPPPLPPEEMAAEAAAGERVLTETMGRLGSTWEKELLPEVHEHLAAFEGFDLAGAGTAELAAHVDDALARFDRLMEIHFRAVFPAYVAMSELDECVKDLLGGGDGATADVFGAYKLMQGLPNKTVEVGHRLWRLSRQARVVPEVMEALAAGPAPAVMAALEATPAGADFAGRLRTFLDDYGQRGDKFFDFECPAWVEDPSPALSNLRTYAGQDDGDSPIAAAERLAAEREEALAAARTRLASYPAPARERFEFLLEAASAGVVISEDHGFWIDFRSAYKLRRVLCEVGRRLAGGCIDEADDVFLLTLDEAKAALTASGDPDASAIDHRPDVARRRAEMEAFASVRPPDLVGTPPPPPPPDMPENPMMRSMEKFSPHMVGAAGPDPAGEAAVVRGHPGSPGTYRGVARLVSTLAEADRLRPGDVLVAVTTTPPWTPLFAVAGAVVTDTGGVLSHGAVVAREYGLPAVVGTTSGTDRIADGDLVEVDGDAGVVRVLEAAQP